MPSKKSDTEMQRFIEQLLSQGMRFSEVRERVAQEFNIKLTSAGYHVWLVKRSLAGRPVGHESSAPHTAETATGGKSGHEQLVQLVHDLGEVLGYESAKGVKLSKFSDAVPSTMRDRTVDAGWIQNGKFRIAIEIQVHGSIDSLVRRLEIAEPYCEKLVMVGSEEDLSKVRNEIGDQKSRSFRDKMVYLSQDALMLEARSIVSLKLLRTKLAL
jgi:hypothetical protein